MVARDSSSLGSVGMRRGPSPLGRNVVVAAAAEPPSEWLDCRRILIDDAVLAAPEDVVAALVDAAHRAESFVIELVADLDDDFDDAPGETDRREQHVLGAGFTFWRDELRHLVWSNAIDARRAEEPRWGAVTAAIDLGAAPCLHDDGDVVLPDGRAVWLDGGPIRHLDPVDGVPVLHVVQIDHRRLETPGPNVTPAALAPDQVAAVTHTTGSARIIAPAGSGKTRVLTERARHLLDGWRIPPGAVGLVAFNRRAQEEMRARTSDLGGLSVRTLNSIALAIVNGTAPFASQQRHWRTIDEPDVRRILQRFVQTPRKLNVDPLAPWIDALSVLRLGLVDPREVEARYGGDVDGLVEIWPAFRDALEHEGAVDFDDQVRRALDLLLTQPVARRAAQRACRVLLVDEFQDLTPAHLLLVRLLTSGGGAVFGVGDDDQTIYGYNGADPAWLIEFGTWFPGSGDHPLEINYRCPAGVVEIADRLLRHNRHRVAKIIRPAPVAGPAPTDAASSGWSMASGPDPVALTVDAVTAAIAGGARPDSIAVLARVNATIAPVQIALSMSGIPITGGVGSEFADRIAVRAALAWLRLATGKTLAGDDLGEALRRPSRALHPRIREWVVEQRSVKALHKLAERITNEKDSGRVAQFASDIAHLQARVSSGSDTAPLVSVLVDDIGLGGAVASLDINRRGMNRASQGDDLLALRQIAQLHPDPSTFERWLRDALVARRDPGGVTVSTVHRVKGQEWPHVVVHLAQADQFPHRLASDVEEERRLFHVAITRASRHVTIVTGAQPSPFCAELTTEPEPFQRETPAIPARTPTRSMLSPRPTSDHPLLVRDRVMAVVGLVLVDQGLEWTVTALESAAAVTERGRAVRRFAIGDNVETAGRQRGLLQPRSDDVSDASVRMFDVLRSYRDRMRNGKPAYTVFDDKTLAAIASALPVDLALLAAVKGVGPAKLEQYGDDILELTAVAISAEA